MRFLLREGNLGIEATEDEKYDFVIQSAKGELTFEQITDWIKVRIKNSI
jgi:hypothetical protein